MSNNKLDVKVYPLNNSQNGTLAYASVGINDLVAITGIRIVESKNGPFVTMPQSRGSDGKFRDIAYPINGDLRKELSAAVMDKYMEAAAEKIESLTNHLRESKEQVYKNNSERVAQPHQSVAKKAYGLGD